MYFCICYVIFMDYFESLRLFLVTTRYPGDIYISKFRLEPYYQAVKEELEKTEFRKIVILGSLLHTEKTLGPGRSLEYLGHVASFFQASKGWEVRVRLNGHPWLRSGH